MIISAILLLAGKGERYEDKEVLKQFIKINDKDLFLFSLEKFIENNNISSIFLVVPKDYIEYVTEKCIPYGNKKQIYVVEGSSTRQLSVFNALRTIKQNFECDYVIIHDAVRPGITKEIIEEHIQGIETTEASTTILPIFDSVINLGENYQTLEYLDRNHTFLVQTPQTFKFDLIYNAHLKAYNNGLYDAKDDLSLLDNSNSVKLLKGSLSNLKVTTKEDFELIESYLKGKETD